MAPRRAKDNECFNTLCCKYLTIYSFLELSRGEATEHIKAHGAAKPTEYLHELRTGFLALTILLQHPRPLRRTSSAPCHCQLSCRTLAGLAWRPLCPCARHTSTGFVVLDLRYSPASAALVLPVLPSAATEPGSAYVSALVSTSVPRWRRSVVRAAADARAAWSMSFEGCLQKFRIAIQQHSRAKSTVACECRCCLRLHMQQEVCRNVARNIVPALEELNVPVSQKLTRVSDRVVGEHLDNARWPAKESGLDASEHLLETLLASRNRTHSCRQLFNC